MKQVKKRIALLLTLVLTVIMLAGCNSATTAVMTVNDKGANLRCTVLIPVDVYENYIISPQTTIDGVKITEYTRKLSPRTINGKSYYELTVSESYTFDELVSKRNIVATQRSFYGLMPSLDEVLANFIVMDANNNPVDPRTLCKSVSLMVSLPQASEKTLLQTNGETVIDSNKFYCVFDFMSFKPGEEIYEYVEGTTNTLEMDRQKLHYTPSVSPTPEPTATATPTPTATAIPTATPVVTPKVTYKTFKKKQKVSYGVVTASGKQASDKSEFKITKATFKFTGGYALYKKGVFMVICNSKTVKKPGKYYNSKKKVFTFKKKGAWNFILRAKHKKTKRLVATRLRQALPLQIWTDGTVDKYLKRL